MRCTSRPSAVASRSRRTIETGHWWRAWPTTAPVCRSTCAHGFSTLFLRGAKVASVSASPSCSRSCWRITRASRWARARGVAPVSTSNSIYMQGRTKPMEAHRILVVDDEAKMRRVLEMSLRNLGHEVVQAGDGAEALACFDDAPVIVLTAYGTIETAVEAMKLGAADYIIRPFEIETVELAVTRALAVGTMQRENRFLRDEAA